MNELTDGTVCAVDAATGAEIGPSRKSRVKGIVERARTAENPRVSEVEALGVLIAWMVERAAPGGGTS